MAFTNTSNEGGFQFQPTNTITRVVRLDPFGGTRPGEEVINDQFKKLLDPLLRKTLK